ncbi:RNA polymerase sigma factor [Streptomyces tibetensis]|uniref:RNA polymerase sigma factor n=1 Tax=Streptomyces tibetensis TaxID=2382123 RepID=UPI00340652A3
MAEVRRIRQANVEALAAVYGEGQAEMTAFTARLLRDRGVPEAIVDAEDVVQKVFLKALVAPELLREPRAYIYAALRREVLHQVQRLHLEHQWEAERLAAQRTIVEAGRDHGPGVTDRIVVRDAVRQLPKQQREAILYTKVEGYTQAETARTMGKSPGTVATHVSRALAALQVSLQVGLSALAVLWIGRVAAWFWNGMRGIEFDHVLEALKIHPVETTVAIVFLSAAFASSVWVFLIKPIRHLYKLWRSVL